MYGLVRRSHKAHSSTTVYLSVKEEDVNTEMEEEESAGEEEDVNAEMEEEESAEEEERKAVGKPMSKGETL